MGVWGPESAESASQNVRIGLYAKSNSEPLKSSKEGRHLVRTVSWEENSGCSMHLTVNKIKS